MSHEDAERNTVEGDRRDQGQPEPPSPEEYLVQPTQLDAHHKMLSEASVLQPHLELLKQELVRYHAHAEGFLSSVQDFMVSSAVPLEYTWSSAQSSTAAAAAAAAAAQAPAGATAHSPDAHIAALRLAVAGAPPLPQTPCQAPTNTTTATAGAPVAVSEGGTQGAVLLTAARDPEAAPVLAPVAPLPPQYADLFRYEVQREACRSAQVGLGAALKERLLPALDLWLEVYEHCKRQLPDVERLRRQHDAANIQLQEAVLAAAARAVTNIAASAAAQDLPAAASQVTEEAPQVADTSMPAAEEPAATATAAAEGRSTRAGLAEDDMVEVAAAARKDLEVLASAVHMAAVSGASGGGGGDQDAGDAPAGVTSVSPGVTVTPRTTSNPHLATSATPGATNASTSSHHHVQGPAADEQAEPPHVAAASLTVSGSSSGGVVGGRLQVVTSAGDVALEWGALEQEDQERLRHREDLLAGLAAVLLPQQETLYQELCWLVAAGVGLKGWPAHLLQAALTAAATRKLPLELLQPFPDHLILKEEQPAGNIKV